MLSKKNHLCKENPHHSKDGANWSSSMDHILSRYENQSYLTRILTFHEVFIHFYICVMQLFDVPVQSNQYMVWIYRLPDSPLPLSELQNLGGGFHLDVQVACLLLKIVGFFLLWEFTSLQIQMKPPILKLSQKEKPHFNSKHASNLHIQMNPSPLWSSHMKNNNSKQATYLVAHPSDTSPLWNCSQMKTKCGLLVSQQLIITVAIFWTGDVEWYSVVWLYLILESCFIHLHSGFIYLQLPVEDAAHSPSMETNRKAVWINALVLHSAC